MMGVLDAGIMYLETVDSAISKPSFSNSPWMRGAPHSGFSLFIRRMSSRSSRPVSYTHLDVYKRQE